jgi:hemerythrin-like domain-containing protein
MSRPTHLLRHEHRVIEQAMRALEGMCVRMRAGGSVRDEEIERLIDFTRGYADRIHHAKEEIHLFPLLERVGMSNQHGALAFLSNEHETERLLLCQMELSAGEYREDPEEREKFISAALQFKDHLIGHMEHEDATLFRLAEELLEDDVKDSLIRTLAGENAKIQSEIDHYERLAEELERSWAV